MLGLISASTARKASILPLIVGLRLDERRKRVTASITGIAHCHRSAFDILTYFLNSVRINVDELLHDQELAMAKAAKPKSRFISLSPRKRKSDENDTPTLTKKAKVLPQTPKVVLPKVTIRLKLGPRPPELDPFPCCLCVSALREGLLPVHDKPLVQHPAYADTKVWMAHESCARVLPETWLDEAETGPVLEGGTRKLEKMVFGVDAIVKDRWNLVSDIPFCQSLSINQVFVL